MELKIVSCPRKGQKYLRAGVQITPIFSARPGHRVKIGLSGQLGRDSIVGLPSNSQPSHLGQHRVLTHSGYDRVNGVKFPTILQVTYVEFMPSHEK